MSSAVVFAYHDVGVRCLKLLLARGVRVPLVVTHADDPAEEVWFQSVLRTAADYGIPALTPEDPNAPGIVACLAECTPDFLFSFYYRRMLKAPLLALARHGALNMHGSLLPRYRGRAPVNWAIIHGETQTGATLHYMAEKPDSGDIVGQTAVPILPDDTAREVFTKVVVAAELTLDAALPALIEGRAPRRAQELGLGGYFPGRKPADGIIDWSKSATEIHNLVRAVAPPYPGARTTLAGLPARILRTRVLTDAPGLHAVATLSAEDGRIVARCGAGALAVLDLEVDGARVAPEAFAARFGRGAVAAGSEG
ncbi:MAG TPA: formyltransferase [Casimicrobiaceae bacterium]|nr:formyltransferase [Casimicrobiaceae bacterium]